MPEAWPDLVGMGIGWPEDKFAPTWTDPNTAKVGPDPEISIGLKLATSGSEPILSDWPELDDLGRFGRSQCARWRKEGVGRRVGRRSRLFGEVYSTPESRFHTRSNARRCRCQPRQAVRPVAWARRAKQLQGLSRVRQPGAPGGARAFRCYMTGQTGRRTSVRGGGSNALAPFSVVDRLRREGRRSSSADFDRGKKRMALGGPRGLSGPASYIMSPPVSMYRGATKAWVFKRSVQKGMVMMRLWLTTPLDNLS